MEDLNLTHLIIKNTELLFKKLFKEYREFYKQSLDHLKYLEPSYKSSESPLWNQIASDIKEYTIHGTEFTRFALRKVYISEDPTYLTKKNQQQIIKHIDMLSNFYKEHIYIPEMEQAILRSQYEIYKMAGDIPDFNDKPISKDIFSQDKMDRISKTYKPYTNKLLAYIQNRSLEELDKLVKILDVTDLAQAQNKLDSTILKLLRLLLSKHCQLFINGSRDIIKDDQYIMVNGDIYIIIMNYNETVGNMIDIAFKNENPLKVEPYQEEKFDLYNSGKYSRLSLFFPEEIASQIRYDFLIDTIQIVISTSYKCIEEKAATIIGENYGVCQRLYNHMRSVFINDKLVDHIWLYTASGDTGFYLMDRKQMEKAMSLFTPLGKKLGISPLKILSEILNKRLRFDTTASKNVTENNETDTVPIGELDYSLNEKELRDAELLLYGDKAATVIPIQSKGKFKLTAGIPVRFKEAIERDLLAHADKIQELFKTTYREIEKISKKEF